MMNFKQLLSGVVLSVVLSNGAWAVVPVPVKDDDLPPPRATALVERSGVITAVRSAVLNVSGVLYSFDASQVIFHAEDNHADREVPLDKGMKVRMKVEKGQNGGMETIREIWVLGK